MSEASDIIRKMVEKELNKLAKDDQSSSGLPSHLCAMPRLMTQKDLAEYLNKSESWCERARWAGEGPTYIKLGRHVRYRVEDVQSWIDKSMNSCTSEYRTS